MREEGLGGWGETGGETGGSSLAQREVAFGVQAFISASSAFLKRSWIVPM